MKRRKEWGEELKKVLCYGCDFRSSLHLRCSQGMIQNKTKCKRHLMDGASI